MPDSWLRRVLSTVSRQTPAYRAAGINPLLGRIQGRRIAPPRVNRLAALVDEPAVPVPLGSMRRRFGTVALAGSTALLLVALSIVTTLYVRERHTSSGTTAANNATISARDDQVRALQGQVSSLKNQLDEAEQKQTGTQNQLDEIAKEKRTIGTCLALLEDAITAAMNGDRATAQAKRDAAKEPCDQAARYLN